jgi:hypothetical protein
LEIYNRNLSNDFTKKEFEVKSMIFFRSNEKLTNNILTSLFYLVVGLFLVVGTVNCGGGSSGPTQAPKAFIQDFIAKHQAMVDVSLVEFYIKEEQAKVSELIDKSINTLKELGTLESTRQATFDFSNLQLQVVGEKEQYVDDEPKTFLKVAVKGSYTMNQKDAAKTIAADEVIILEMVGNNWKVTETINPWS